MCGIVGYVGYRQATDVVLDGLKRLEYRGYDSAGVVVSPRGADGEAGRASLSVVKKAGKLVNLKNAVAANPPRGTLGMGHTRWATHGRPNDANAHPHLSEDGKLAVIHNGIIENYVALKGAAARARSHLLIRHRHRGDGPSYRGPLRGGRCRGPGRGGARQLTRGDGRVRRGRVARRA